MSSKRMFGKTPKAFVSAALCVFSLALTAPPPSQHPVSPPAGARAEASPAHKALAVATLPGDENWDDRFGPQAIIGNINAMTTDEEGNLIVWGLGSAGYALARWDGVRWATIENSLFSRIMALTFRNGVLYAAGDTDPDPSSYDYRVAQWGGEAWTVLGGNLNSWILALAVDDAGHVYAGGQFTTAGGVTVNGIAEWDGSTWSDLDGGITGGDQYMLPYVMALTFDNEGNLYTGGWFTGVGGIPVNYIAKWDGNHWLSLGSGLQNAAESLEWSDGILYVGGYFTEASGLPANHIARWNGSTWSALGSGVNGGFMWTTVTGMAADGRGNLYIVGEFTTAGGLSVQGAACWNGSTWDDLGGGVGAGGTRFVAIDHTGTVITGSSALRGWDGTHWGPVQGGLAGNGTGTTLVHALASFGGQIYVGGSFATAGNQITANIARWDGSRWWPLGSGVAGWVAAMAFDSQGNLYVGGGFEQAGGVTVNNIAKWDGSSWSALGLGTNGDVRTVAVDANDNLYVSGWFTEVDDENYGDIVKWDGQQWSGLGVTIMDGYVADLATYGDSVLAAGTFTMLNGTTVNRLVEWHNGQWWYFGSGANNTVEDVEVDARGNLYIAGALTEIDGVPVNHIAKLDAFGWSNVGGGTDMSIAALDIDGAGNLYIAGAFTMAGSVPANRVVRWDGTTWTAYGSGIGGYNEGVSSLVVSGGDLYAGGYFTTAGSKPSSYFAHYSNLKTYLPLIAR